MADKRLPINNIAVMIEKKLPVHWKLVKKEFGALPHGHYWGQKYNGPKGLLLVLEGEKDVFLNWMDKNGDWQQEALAKESLELWIMPLEYSQSWKRFFVFHRPISAELLFSGKKFTVYCYQSHVIVSQKRFNSILSNAKSTKWIDSPANKGKLSWITWKNDLQDFFEEAQ